MKLKKNLIKTLAAVSLALTIIPAAAFAAPTNENIQVQPFSTSVTWNFTNIGTSKISDPVAIGSDLSELKLKMIRQGATSGSTSPKIEYRLMKVNSNGTLSDSGIYDVIAGAYPAPASTQTTLYNVPAGTYKLKVSVLNDVSSSWSEGTIYIP